MFAVVKEARGPGNVRYREVAEPAPADGQVVVDVIAAGICGSDLHILDDDIALRLKPPVVMGHEFVGRIRTIGRDVVGWSTGDAVVSETAFSVCGHCEMCRTGHDNACASKELIGYAHNGAFAPRLLLPAERLHRPPSGFDENALALCEPLAGCVHGLLEQCAVLPGDLVVIAGPGTVGLLSLQIATAAGATVVVCGRSDHRLALASQLGATHVINVNRDSAEELIRELSSDHGCDVFVEAAGNATTVELGLEVLGRRGRFLAHGLHRLPITVPIGQVAYKELTITGTLGQKRSAWRRALTLLESGAVRLEPLVSDVLPLSEWEVAFAKVRERTGLKVIMRPGT